MTEKQGCMRTRDIKSRNCSAIIYLLGVKQKTSKEQDKPARARMQPCLEKYDTRLKYVHD